MLSVLFLCVHNSARSQIAEGLLRAMAGDRAEVFSAGSDPTSVHPFALRVLQDEGIDASKQYSKSVEELPNQRFDYAITLCVDEVCPTLPAATTRLHWDLRDPSAVEGDAEARLEAFRATLIELKDRITRFVRDAIGDRDQTFAG